MEITALNAYPLRTAIEEPCWTAHGYYDTSELVLIEVETDIGLTGYGESRGSPQTLVCEYLERFEDIVVGTDPRGNVPLWETLVSTMGPRPGGLGGWDRLPAPFPRDHRPQIMCAIGGIDIALWDLKGKDAGVPVYKLLGGTRSDVPAYATGGMYLEDRPIAGCAEELAGYVEDGFEAVKLKSGALSLEDELTRIENTREAIGEDVQLMLDLNAPFGVEECIRFSREVESYDITWLEEPLRWYLHPDDFRRVAEASSIPLAHGERELHRFSVREFIDSGAIRYVQFDSARFGGFTEAVRIAHYAEQSGVSIAPHDVPYVHAHLVSAFYDSSFAAEVLPKDGFRAIPQKLYSERADFEDGTLRIPDEPGFGLEIEWDRVDEWLVE